jgi:hypothetical protein
MDKFREGYATYDDFDALGYNCVKFLIDNNENIWKLLKYLSPDAWEKPNLTRQEKASLIYAGQENIFDYRVFMDLGQPDVITQEACIIRISPYSIFPENRSIGTISIMFEVYSHYKINHLSNYKTRVDTIMKEFLKTFNGVNVGGIGLLNFDRLANQSARLENGGQLPFRGKWLLMGVKSN